MISCPKCGKENQDHYKFCLGCGNELPRDGHGARPFQPTPPAGVQSPAAADRPRAAAPGPGIGGGAPFGAPAGPPGPPPGPSPFGGPPAGPSPFGGPPPGPSPFGAPAAPPAGLGSAGPFGGAPIPSSLGAAPAPAPAAAPAQAHGPAASCPQCGTPNTRGARFCLTCGNDLSTAAAAPAPAPAPASMAQPAPMPQVSAPVAAPAPVQQYAPASAPPASAPAMAARPSSARLVLIRPDGSEGGTFQLNEGATLVGREAGGLFAGDSYLSPRHATFKVTGQTISVRDENSLNGVYLRIERQAPVEIRDGDVFRIGQEILHYVAYKPVAPESDGTEKQGAQLEGLVGRISLVIGRDTYGNSFPIPVTGLFLGRERGDILFPEDGYVSGLHCQLTVEGGKVMLTDVGSSNGSYVRVRGERTIQNGDLLLVGQQLFRLTL